MYAVRENSEGTAGERSQHFGLQPFPAPSFNNGMKTPMRAVVYGASAGFAGWLTYAAASWIAFGKAGVDRRSDSLADPFMPVYDVVERHEVQVAAPAGITFEAARNLRLGQSPTIRAIFRARELLLRSPRTHNSADDKPLIEEMLELGWGVLEETPGRAVVMGSVTQPWQANVTFRAVDPNDFAAFAEPGFVRIVWTIEVFPLTTATSLFRTVTRAKATDAHARKLFRLYWAFLSPGIWLIRVEALRIVRDRAERRFAGRLC